MTIRTRKFFGTIALLVLVVVWSLMGMTIAQTPWLASSGLVAGDLLRRGGPWMGVAGDADHELDVAAGSRGVSAYRRSGSRPFLKATAVKRVPRGDSA